MSPRQQETQRSPNPALFGGASPCRTKSILSSDDTPRSWQAAGLGSVVGSQPAALARSPRTVWRWRPDQHRAQVLVVLEFAYQLEGVALQAETEADDGDHQPDEDQDDVHLGPVRPRRPRHLAVEPALDPVAERGDVPARRGHNRLKLGLERPGGEPAIRRRSC